MIITISVVRPLCLILCLNAAANVVMAIEPIVLVHGGAGDIPAERHEGKYRGSKLAARLGYQTLIEKGSVLDAVEMAVRSMELDENFNCGYGSVLTRNYTVEMDASIMDGRTLNAGCVTLVQDIFHPITLARRVMEHAPHTFLGADATRDFAKAQGFKILKPGDLVTQRSTDSLDAFLQGNSLVKSEVGTVGAVAIDSEGNIAAATSTGGTTGKYMGRIGDSPLIGSGTYADNRFGGVSTTGFGDYIMRVALAKDIISRIQFAGMTAHEATTASLADMLTMTGVTAGAITIDHEGNVGFDWNSEKMSFAYLKEGSLCYGITREDRANPICESV